MAQLLALFFCWMYLLSAACIHTARAQQLTSPPLGTTGEPLLPTAEASGATQTLDNAAVFKQFMAWTSKYLAAATPTAREVLLEEGLKIARERRSVLAKLILTDPKRALEHAVSIPTREQLPPSILEQLEERISARGEYAVLIFDEINPQTGAKRSRLERNAEVNGQAYRAMVYGRRLSVTTKNRMAFHGIALNRYLAIHESPVRVLEEGEQPNPKASLGNPDKRCPVYMRDAAAGIVADVGGVLYFFDSSDDLKTFTKRIEAQEDIIDPEATGLDEKPAA